MLNETYCPFVSGRTPHRKATNAEFPLRKVSSVQAAVLDGFGDLRGEDRAAIGDIGISCTHGPRVGVYHQMSI